MSILYSFFNWPNGQVWPNLVASAISFTCGLLVAKRHVGKHVQELHKKLDNVIWSQEPPSD